MTEEATQKTNPDWSKLPKWDLQKTFGYTGPNDPQIKKELSEVVAEANRFAEKYKGKLALLPGDELAQFCSEYEALTKKTGRVDMYAYLLLSTNTQDKHAKRLETLSQETGAKIEVILNFADLEIGKINPAKMDKKYQESSKLQHWKPFLEKVRRYRNYMLSDKEESLLSLLGPTSTESWQKFYTEEETRLKFHVGGKTMDSTELGNLLDDPSEEIRRAAFAEKSQVMQPDTPFVRLAAKLLNNIIAAGSVENDLRGYKHPMASRNISNNVEDQVVDTIINTVKENYHRTSHRYNKLKAEIIGKDKLEAHNSYAPAPAVAKPTIIPWEEAKQIVLDAYSEFSPTMAAYAKRMFDEGYIDAAIKQGKEGGAYEMSPGVTEHPFVLTNYQGKAEDVVTLAHELGHAIHDWMAYQAQGKLMGGISLTLAETASTFGEELVFEKLLQRIKSPTERKVLLINKIESGLNTIEFQVSIADFEREIHQKRKEGELDVEDFNKIWMEKLKEREGQDYVPSPAALKVQVSNLCEFIASDNLSAHQKKTACDAINIALGLKGEKLITTDTLNEIDSRDNLVSSISETYHDKPDKMQGFKDAVSGKLEENHPLKTYHDQSSGQETSWSGIEHIFSSPFYVYSYAFGELLVEAMFEARREGKIDNFEEKYLDILKSADTKHHKELLAPLGLDASQPDFWQKGIDVRIRRIDELEKLVNEEKAALKSLDGLSVAKLRGNDGQYMIDVPLRRNEKPDEYNERMQAISDALSAALGYEVSKSRGQVYIDHADGLVGQKLHEMAEQRGALRVAT